MLFSLRSWATIFNAVFSFLMCDRERTWRKGRKKTQNESQKYYSTMQWTLAWKAVCYETFWVVRFGEAAFECAKLKYVMLFSLFIIFVQVFSIQLIIKQSENVTGFFLFCFHVFVMLLFGVPHAHPKYWHVNNVPTAIIHRVKKTRLFVILRILFSFSLGSPFFWHSNTFNERFWYYSLVIVICQPFYFLSSYLFFRCCWFFFIYSLHFFSWWLLLCFF